VNSSGSSARRLGSAVYYSPDFLARTIRRRCAVLRIDMSRSGKTPVIYFLTAVSSWSLLACPSSSAPRAKGRTAGPVAKQETVRSVFIPTNENDCADISNALNKQAKSLSKTARQVVPREFVRVASDLDQSCKQGDFGKAWISIEWMNGCVNNFTNDPELGFCSKNEGYSCAINPKSEGCLDSQ
jgi:hypothetical protein